MCLMIARSLEPCLVSSRLGTMDRHLGYSPARRILGLIPDRTLFDWFGFDRRLAQRVAEVSPRAPRRRRTS
ncbi:hypothetical protein CCHR01_16184 [Colletotrichum chrysophilum]|uniref:Uncharacterized protein n=1 Tax=Colletotrichum chrysophilum TaxID=1836956 RepID=A0AAD9A4M6_9PEZI|nr:hypothetical protein CCHR01_16184 [Colletotrichum chrysophilum]